MSKARGHVIIPLHGSDKGSACRHKVALAMHAGQASNVRAGARREHLDRRAGISDWQCDARAGVRTGARGPRTGSVTCARACGLACEKLGSDKALREKETCASGAHKVREAGGPNG